MTTDDFYAMLHDILNEHDLLNEYDLLNICMIDYHYEILEKDYFVNSHTCHILKHSGLVLYIIKEMRE